MLFNALVNAPAEIESRIQLRQDLSVAGLSESFRYLRSEENTEDAFSDIIKYIDIYESMTAKDSSEYEKLKPEGIDVNDMTELFTSLKLKFQNEQFGDAFLSLLQHLLLVPEGNFG